MYIGYIDILDFQIVGECQKQVLLVIPVAKSQCNTPNIGRYRYQALAKWDKYGYLIRDWNICRAYDQGTEIKIKDNMIYADTGFT